VQPYENRGGRGIWTLSNFEPGRPLDIARRPFQVFAHNAPVHTGALTSPRPWKRPDARRLPDDTRRAPQPNRELQAFGTAESNLREFRGRKRANRRTHRTR